MSKHCIPLFKLNPEGRPRAAAIMGVSTSADDIDAFVKHFNEYIMEYNKRTNIQDRLSALGYFAAALTAIFSFILS